MESPQLRTRDTSPAANDNFRNISRYENRKGVPVVESADRRIRQIRLGVPKDWERYSEFVAHVNDLVAVGKKEGFTVELEEQTHSRGDIFVEDKRILLRENDAEMWLIGNQDQNLVDFAIQEATGMKSPRTGNPREAQEVANAKGIETRQARGWYEGGNVLITKRRGRVTVLIGENTISVNQELFRAQGAATCSLDATLLLIAKDFGVESRDIVVVPQKGESRYGAIDMMLRPGKGNQIFVNDRGLTKQWMKDLKKADPDNYSVDVDAKLSIFDNTAASKKMQVALVNAGFDVVPFPGELTGSFNFANGIMGKGCDNQSFYITNEAEWPALNMKFVSFMKRHGYRVHFVKTDHVLRQSSGGIDCMTTEMT